MAKLEHLDLFSGIGGFSLGLERAGFTTTQFVECNDHAQQILKKHWPHVAIHANILDYSPRKEKFSIITGGFPCQDISVAGTQKGLKGERSGLWSEFKRVIREAETPYVIIENSSNLRNLGLEVVLKDLWEIGYDAEWFVLEAGQFGAPHVRERIFIIAYPLGTRGERLVKDEHLVSLRQRRVCSKEDLQTVYEDPFRRSPRWPKPLLCRGDDGLSRRLDRLTRIGNSVYPPIAEFFGKIIKQELELR